MGRRGTSGPAGRRAAAGGILAAASLALLWVASAVPSGRLGLTAAAGLFPAAAVLAAGPAAGYLCWGAAGLLGLLLVPDKTMALLYVIFLGLYPVVKGNIEMLRRLPLEWCLKLLFFNAALALCWFLFRELFLSALPDWLGKSAPLLWLAGNVVFAVYDVGLTKLIGLLRYRLDRSRRG